MAIRASKIGVAIILLGLLFAHGQNLSDDDKRGARELFRSINRDGDPISMSKVRMLSIEDRELLRAYFKNRDEEGRRRGDYDEQLTLRLAMLGDAEARDRLVRTWVDGIHGERRIWMPPHALVRLESPEVIAQIGEHLFMNEKEQWPSDVGYPAPQDSAFYVIAVTLLNSPAFNSSVRSWANDLYPFGKQQRWPVKGSLEMMRRWYRDNETPLKRGDFAAVQPGPPVPQEEKPPAAATSPFGTASSPTSPTAPQPTSEPALTSSEWTFAALAAGCLAVFGGLFYFWKRRT